MMIRGFSKTLSLVMLASGTWLAMGCSGAPEEASPDSASDEQAVRACAPLTVTTAAKLLPAGAHQGTVGTFALMYSERSFDALTGAGPWSAWSSYDTGKVTFTTGNDSQVGPVVWMMLQGSYYPQTGFNQTVWDITASGIVRNDWVADRTTEVEWYVRGGGGGAQAVFQTKDITATACALRATSGPARNGGKEFRFQVRVTFAKST